MSFLRQKVVGFIRQLSAPNYNGYQDDTRIQSECFIQHYLKGREVYRNEPDILHGRTPQELPPKIIGDVSETVIASVTGPTGGLTTVNKNQKHLSISDPDVHFIDVPDEELASPSQSDASAQKDLNSNVASAAKEGNVGRDFIPLQKSESAPVTCHRVENEEQNIPSSENSSTIEEVEIAGILNWNNPQLEAYGSSITLYELHPLTRINAGDPIADCFSLVARKNSAILVLADGVNWGQKACIAARAAVHGCVDYLNKALLSLSKQENFTTTDVFVSLLRSFHSAHNLIIQEDGMFTTLTAVIVLPLKTPGRFVACCCNVGDSLAYVYSPRYGVREITQGSHDVHTMRDMRDALGALGPVDGQNPELSNLTLSVTEVEPGDLVFVTSDGISDNLDPVVGKFAGLPAVEAHQRHKLSLLRTEDLLKNGVSGKGPPVKSARELVTILLDFVTRLTAAKRKILEDADLYVTKDGRALNKIEQRTKRKEMCGKLSMVPGKLDHATVAAYLVGEL